MVTSLTGRLGVNAAKHAREDKEKEPDPVPIHHPANAEKRVLETANRSLGVMLTIVPVSVINYNLSVVKFARQYLSLYFSH